MSEPKNRSQGERLAKVTIYAVTAALVLGTLALFGAMVWVVLSAPWRNPGPVTWPEAVRTGTVAMAGAGAFAAWARWGRRK